MIHIENSPMGERQKSMGAPNSHWDPMGIGDFMIKFHEFQNHFLNISFIIVHVLSANYHYAKFHYDSLVNKKNKFANNLDLQT